MMNEERLVRYLAAFNTRDYDRMISYYRPEVRLELPAATLGPDPRRSRPTTRTSTPTCGSCSASISF
jgi:hypothetical protein